MSHKKKDLTGQYFGRLKALFYYRYYNNRSWWFCECACGNFKSIRTDGLTTGHAQSCGCFLKDTLTSHGMTKTRTYNVYRNLFQRCYNPKSKEYKNYGARGIKVCDRWLNSFKNFLEDMGESPKGLTIERINNNGNYEPENCKWATYLEQNNNTRRNSYLTHQGETLTVAQWSKKLGINKDTLLGRKERNWSDELALITPVKSEMAKNQYLTLNGETKTISQWSQELNIHRDTLFSRKYSGWSDEKILTTPIKPRKRNNSEEHPSV